MNIRIYPTLLLTMIAIIILPGCEKFYDYVRSDDLKVCRVQKLKFGNPERRGEVTILYNAAGDPTDMIHTAPDALGYDYHFRYDNRGRLSDFYFNFHFALGVFVWHRYSYPNNRTIIDSAFPYVGLITDSIPPHQGPPGFHARVFVNELDEWGRVIKNTELYQSPDIPPFIITFSYDSRGNLVRPGVEYDNKVNVYRTNKVWRFIYNDYSLNNPLAAGATITEYNYYGLPVKFKGRDGPFFYGPDLEIDYDCYQGGSL